MVNAKISLSLRQESSSRNSLEVICISVWNQADYPCWKTKSKSADDAVKTSDQSDPPCPVECKQRWRVVISGSYDGY